MSNASTVFSVNLRPHQEHDGFVSPCQQLAFPQAWHRKKSMLLQYGQPGYPVAA